MVVLSDGLREPGRVARAALRVTMESFHDRPAPVLTANARGLEVDLLVGVLADVRDEQVAIRGIERVAPRIPHSVGPDLRPRPRRADERVVRRNAVRELRVDVDAQHLAEQRANVLGIVELVSPAAAIPEADVEIAVRPD